MTEDDLRILKDRISFSPAQVEVVSRYISECTAADIRGMEAETEKLLCGFDERLKETDAMLDRVLVRIGARS